MLDVLVQTSYNVKLDFEKCVVCICYCIYSSFSRCFQEELRPNRVRELQLPSCISVRKTYLINHGVQLAFSP